MQSVLLECAVRAALIALGTGVVLRLLRVRSAAARHAAWSVVVAIMLLLPVWMGGVAASLRVLPASPAPVSAVAPLLLSLPVTTGAVHPPAPHHTWNWLAIVYFAGVFFFLPRLAVGTLRAHLLVRCATLTGGRHTSAACAAPITVGWLCPVVVFPQSWSAWSPEQLDAVLTHEGEHVRRRDPLVQWLALLNRAIFWFHPLAWWLEHRLSALAEEACDAAVIQRGHDPRDYSQYLLELARAVGQAGSRVRALGMAMPGSALPSRIRQILSSAPAPRSTRVRAISLAVTLAVLSVMAVASVDRQAPVPPPPPAAPVPPPAPRVEVPAVPAPPGPPPAPAEADAIWLDNDAPPPAPPEPPAPAPLAAPMPPPPPPIPVQSEGRMIALYFDLDGTKAEQLSRTTAASVKFLDTQMRADDKVAILVRASGRVKVVQDFTGNEDRLRDALDHLESNPNLDAGGWSGLQLAAQILATMRERVGLVYFASSLKDLFADCVRAIECGALHRRCRWPARRATQMRYADSEGEHSECFCVTFVSELPCRSDSSSPHRPRKCPPSDKRPPRSRCLPKRAVWWTSRASAVSGWCCISIPKI